MTTNHPNDLGAHGAHGAAVPDSGATTPRATGSGADSTAQQAQDKARETAGTAAEETRHVAGVA